VLNQPLSPAVGQGAPSDGDTVRVAGHKLSIGIVILLCVVCFAVAVAILFAGWWYTQRRKAKQGRLGNGGWINDGEKVELRALGTRTTDSTGSGGGAKKSGSYHRSEQSDGVNSVKFVEMGDTDEFGDNR